MAERGHSRRDGLAARQRGPRGLGLVELLVATSLAAVVLAASWAWLWDCGGVAREVGADAQAATVAAYALRVVASDVSMATALSAPPASLSPQIALCVQQRPRGGAAEAVLIAWDGGRDVLWRKAHGTYLADHVRGFAISYYRADGSALTRDRS